jgi:hypothetical protein
LTETSLPPGIRVGEPVGAEGASVQIKGNPGSAGIFQFRLPGGLLRRGVNTPYEESDLSKISTEELKKKFVASNIKIVAYREGSLKNLRGGRKELWPILLGFLLAVLAAETLLANGLLRFK